MRNRLVDGALVALAGLAALVIALHGAARIVTGLGRKKAPHVVERVFLHSAGTRIWHWANALLMVVLMVTGFRMHFGGREDPVLSFETAFNVHNLAGVVLVLAALYFFVANQVTGAVRQYTRRHESGATGLFGQARWYLVGIFTGAPHPFHPTAERKFNPLQRLTYLGVMYVLYPLVVVTGVVLLFPGVLPDRILGRPGTWWIAAAHYLFAAFATLFLLGHIYLATTGDRLSYLLSGMITGWHKQHGEKADSEPEGEGDSSPSSS